MARFNLDKAEFFGGQGGGGFLSFKHRDTARIRILYNSINDVEGYAVHSVELNGKKRYVDCLRGAHEPTRKCPLCRAGYFTEVKYLIPVYDEDSGMVLTWDRGKTYGDKIKSLFKYCAEGESLASICFRVTKEINVKGVPFYTFEPEYSDGATTADLPEYNSDIYGGLILLKTAEEMEDYLEYGDFYGEDAV